MVLDITHDKISINLDHFVKQYFINASFEYLLAAVHHLCRQHTERDLEIIAAVQTPLTLEPFASVIDSLARVSRLPPSRIKLKTRNRSLCHPKATVVLDEDHELFWLARATVKEIAKLSFQYNDSVKWFGALFGRCSFPRLDLAFHLDRFYRDHSVVTFHATQQHVEDCVTGMEIMFADHLHWIKTWKNPEISVQGECMRGALNFPTNLQTWPELWGQYFIEVIVETDYHSRCDFTEKTYKCLASGKPFVLMSGAGSLDEIRNMGFKTFDPWIDESYDLELEACQRLHLIKQEIARLTGLSQIQTQQTISALLELADFNRIRMQELYV